MRPLFFALFTLALVARPASAGADEDARAALALSGARQPVKAACDCAGPSDCTCAWACDCRNCAAAAGPKLPAAPRCEWKAMSNGDVAHLSLERDGRPVGTLRLADGKYWDYGAGPLVECEPPITPPKDCPKAAPLRAAGPGVYLAPQWAMFPVPAYCPAGT
jgi:hypothetical protein